MCRFFPCRLWFGVQFIVSTTTVKSAAVSVSKLSKNFKWQHSTMGALCSCEFDSDLDSYEAAGVSRKSHLSIANLTEIYKKTLRTTLFQLRCSACQVLMTNIRWHKISFTGPQCSACWYLQGNWHTFAYFCMYISATLVVCQWFMLVLVL